MNDTRRRYDVTCAACGHEFTAAKSTSMLCGDNHGHGRCPNCDEFLHLEMSPDLQGERMVSQVWNDWATVHYGPDAEVEED